MSYTLREALHELLIWIRAYSGVEQIISTPSSSTGIGRDIKDVLREVGEQIAVTRLGLSLSGEYIKTTQKTTTPQLQDYCLDAMFPYDSFCLEGDVVQFVTTRKRYVVMVKVPDLFEDSVFRYRGALFKCNVSGELLRSSGEVWDGNYHKTPVWTQASPCCYSFLTEKLIGNKLDTETAIGDITTGKKESYIPKSYGVRINDRYCPISGEYFRVESIDRYKYPGVDVVELGEDVRE